MTRRGHLPRAPAPWLLVAALAVASHAQHAAGQAPAAAGQAPAQAALFRSDSVLAVTLRADLRSLFRDRDTANAPWREATLTYAGPDSAVTVPLRLRTRGAFRLRECEMPPIRMRFNDRDARGTPFEDLRRPKLITHCRDRTEHEQYLLHEYTIYRLYRLFTPVSFPARLLRVTYQDLANAVRPVTRYAFVTEDPERLAARFSATILDSQGVRLGRLDRPLIQQLSIFQYLIANTDWGVPPLHNVVLLRTADSVIHAVPYDFDWSGAIDASYARPAAMLHTTSVRQRVYRGICQLAAGMDPVLSRFEALRDSIAAVYRAVPDLDPRLIERTLRYYDEFYWEIADRQRFEQLVVAPGCVW